MTFAHTLSTPRTTARRSGLVPCGPPIATAIALALLFAQSAAAQVAVAPGQTVTVVPGSPNEGLDFDVRGGTLNVQGARVGVVSTESVPGSVVTLDGATANGAVNSYHATVTIRGSTITNPAPGTGFAAYGVYTNGLANGGPTLPRSLLTVIDSQVTGQAGGLTIAAGGVVDVQASTLSGGINGARIQAGSAEFRRGSRIIGGTNGLQAIFSATGQPINSTPDQWYVLIDGSTVQGQAGSAIRVESILRGPELARITVQNGATLLGGNGNLVEVGADAMLDFTARTSTLSGDFVIDAAAGDTVLRFLDGLQLTGRVLGAADVVVDQGGRWTLSGDSNTGNLTLGAGSDIVLGGTGQFAHLTVNGNYIGQGGTLHFNTVLASDAADTSSLQVTGATSGTTQVAVTNINGPGAQTVNGIRLVQVGGASDGQFILQGRAIGGMYEYFLHKGTDAAPADGNWYLRSTYTGDPCDLNPALPECIIDPIEPEPVLRPEPGAYLANQAAAVQMFQVRRHDRGAPGLDGESNGTWVRATRDQLQTTIAGQVDTTTHTDAVHLGTDLWRWGQTGRGQVGLMLATGQARTDARSLLTGYRTRGKVSGDSAGLYAGWVQDSGSSRGAYVDAWAQYARFDNEVQGDTLTRESYDSRSRSASLEAGYAWRLHGSDEGELYLQPQVQLVYTDITSDRVEEANGTIVEDDTAGGLQSRVGLRLFGNRLGAGNRVQPFLAVNWLHSSRAEVLRFNDERLDADLPDSRYEAQAGAQLQLGQRWLAWGDLRVQRGNNGYRDAAAQIGLRAGW